MKNLKLFCLALSGLMALSLTSCINNDDTENLALTMSDIGQCLAIARGDYSGKLLYQSRQATDTTDVNWSVTADTMLIIKDFPTAAITEKINNADLKAAMAEQCPTWALKCDMAFTMLDPYVEFLLGPLNMEIPVRYKNVDHKLKVIFWYSNSSFGAVEPKTKEMTLRLVIAAAYLDGDENKNLFSGTNSVEQIPIAISTTLTKLTASSQASV